jgi:putative flippase GtrA
MNQSLLHQIIRYGAVGLIVFACDFATYAVIVHAVPGAYLPGNIAGKVIGAAIGFVLHKRFTFSWAQKHGAGHQALSYLGLILLNFSTSSALLWLLVAQLDFDKFVAKIIVDTVVMATSFLFGRLWVYKPA